MTLDLRELDALVLAPRAAAVDQNDHFVELYEDEAALARSVRTFMSIGHNDGEAAVVIATPSHRDAIETELAAAVDLVAARAEGLYTALDAAETVSLFMDGDEVDPHAVNRVIGAVLTAAGRGGRRIRVFGEMVSLLWGEGNVSGALALEDEWNELAKSHRFRLFCAYPSSVFGADDTAGLTGVCSRHSHVVVPAR